LVRLTTVQSTTLRLPGEDVLIRHQMQGETHDIVQRHAGGDWRFVERRLQVVFPFDIKLGPADRHSTARDEGGLEDGGLYYVKARNGEVSVARYFARHNLFFAVGAAIGYFPGDLVVGRRVPLDDAFDTLR
jgi:hypothetical protein